MKSVSYIGVVVAAALLAGCSNVRGAGRAASAWTVSKGYTAQNQTVPGAMIAYSESLGSFPSSWGDRTAELSVRCAGRQWSVYLNPGIAPEPEAGAGSDATVEYRLDGGPAVSALDEVEGGNVRIGGAALVRQMLKADRLSVNFHPLDSAPAAVTFDLRGFSGGAASQLQQSCAALD